MKKVFIVFLLLLFASPAFAVVDLYILQYGVETSRPCEGTDSRFINTVYCYTPPTYEVYTTIEKAKERLRNSDPVKAFKVTCLMEYAKTCLVDEMVIVTAKDLQEKPAELHYITIDNTFVMDLNR